MQFGFTLKPDHAVDRLVALTRQAEAAGFTYGWVFDSHVLWREVYPLLTLMAINTTRLRLGTCVTNPATREPSVTASVLATLNESTWRNALLMALVVLLVATSCGPQTGGEADEEVGVSREALYYDRPATLLASAGFVRELKLVGSRSNRSAIGAEVTLEFSNVRQRRVVDGGSGFCSQNDRRLHFGLGEMRPGRVIIRWPSGREQIVEGLRADQLHVITEPA